MIRFDSDSIYNRIVNKLQQNPDWNAIMKDSVVDAVIRSNAEANAETSRYAEYLFKESRWDTAQNPTSVVSMANMLGYQPKRKISSQGKLYVSLDPKNHSVGTSLTLETYLGMRDIENTNSENYRNAWIRSSSGNVLIDSSCKVKDSSGVDYIVTTPAVLKSNDYFVSVDIMQGTKRSKYIDIDTIRSTYTISKLNPYLYIPVTLRNCENASNIASRKFLSVYVVYPGNSENTETLIPYRVVDSLLLSSEEDYDVELYNDLYNQDVFYLKFRNDLYGGRAIDLSQNSSVLGIRIDYVESLGFNSNIEDRYKQFTIEDAVLDKGNNDTTRVRLYGINYTSLIGGYDEESISSIKRNAIKEYTKYYTIGTKESYQNTIANSTFKFTIDGNSYIISPKKVNVYGGYENRVPVTRVSFIGEGMDDLSTLSLDDDVYLEITKALNNYLARLKSPQDTLRFVAPVYTSFAVGLKCNVKSDNSSEMNSLASSISSYIDSKWGPNSDEIDFEKSFFASKEQSDILREFTDVESLNIEVEAVTKADWSGARLMAPNGDVSTEIHTFRIPFSFSSVFLGNKPTKGFKDYSTGSKYVMRIDFLYKKPTNILNQASLNTSLFIDSEAKEGQRYTDGFRICVENKDNIWPDLETLSSSMEYSSLSGLDDLKSSYLIEFKNKVYDDSDYILLKKDVEQTHKIATRDSSTLGGIDNYLIYFSGDYTTEQGDDDIGSGWIELTFDEIYKVLESFAIYDNTLALKLRSCALSALKCGVADGDVFKKFRDIISKYLDIYISMRPFDSDLRIRSSESSGAAGFEGSNEILYIDSYDTKILDVGSSGESVTNLTSDKKSRFISVECSYGGNI